MQLEVLTNQTRYSGGGALKRRELKIVLALDGMIKSEVSVFSLKYVNQS